MLHFIIPLAIAAFIIYQLGLAIYNLHFHPLAKWPGPKLWIAFPVTRYIDDIRGTSQHRIQKLHEKYGETVRVRNDELSFTTADAWKDIYGHGKSLPKVDRREHGQPASIIISDTADHTRFRKAISHGFSEKGLRSQEPIIREYVDELIGALHEEAEAGRPVEITQWMNRTTFSIISDLSFGQSVIDLKVKGRSEFIDALFDFLYLGPTINLQRNFPNFWNTTVGFFFNRSMATKRARFRQLSADTAMNRAYDTEKAGRGDLMDSMLRHRGGKDGLSDEEISANAVILMIAGSETTATLLSGILYYLGQNPEILSKVTSEVRSAYTSVSEIDFLSASNKLPYMLACLDETLRIYPPVPGMVFNRITTEPVTTISGESIPKGTQVGVHQIGSNWTERNFHRAREFHPERWLSSSTTDPSSPFYNDNRAVFQPFSYGPRNCIGKNLACNEMRLILARVLFEFDLELLEESRDTWEDQKIKVLWVKHPLWCRLHKRSMEV